MTAQATIRVRFCSFPIGTPHVGLIRTALFKGPFARHAGGVFVFRIEDTDASRDTAESYAALLDALRDRDDPRGRRPRRVHFSAAAGPGGRSSERARSARPA